MKRILIALTILVGLVLSASAAPIEWWDMNDTAGTDLNDLSNSGTLGSVWNFNTTGMTTDGNGLFVIAGDGGTTTRKMPKKGTTNAEALNDVYSAPITTGAYSLTVDFASWTFAAGSLGDQWKIKAQDSSGTDIAGIEIGMDTASSARIRMWTQGTSNQYYRTFSYNLTEASGALVELEFDFDNDTVSYNIDGSEEYAFTDFSGVNIGTMSITTAGDTTDDWVTAASNVKIDAIGLDVIPEPATVGLLGLGAVTSLIIRRIKR